jgi:hypothetical protein
MRPRAASCAKPAEVNSDPTSIAIKIRVSASTGIAESM